MHLLHKMMRHSNTVVLDLDDTLVKVSKDKIPGVNNYMVVEVESIDDERIFYYVYPRPHLDKFIQTFAKYF